MVVSSTGAGNRDNGTHIQAYKSQLLQMDPSNELHHAHCAIHKAGCCFNTIPSCYRHTETQAAAHTTLAQHDAGKNQTNNHFSVYSWIRWQFS